MARAPSWPCPGHDERDWEFAKKHGIEIRQVIAPADGNGDRYPGPAVYVGLRHVLVNSGEWDGLDFEAAFNAIADHFETDGPRAPCRELSPA